MNQFKGNSMIDEPLENSSDGEGDTVNDVDNENFNIYVEHNFPHVYESFISGKGQIKCYLGKYISKSSTMLKN